MCRLTNVATTSKYELASNSLISISIGIESRIQLYLNKVLVMNYMLKEKTASVPYINIARVGIPFSVKCSDLHLTTSRLAHTVDRLVVVIVKCLHFLGRPYTCLKHNIV